MQLRQQNYTCGAEPVYTLQVLSSPYLGSGEEAQSCPQGGRVWFSYPLAEEVVIDRVSSVKMTEEGRQALLKLTKGDMRRALNVLQACHAAYDLTGETEVYNCTGNPHPSDIETIVTSMLTDEFTTAYNSGCECGSNRDEH